MTSETERFHKNHRRERVASFGSRLRRHASEPLHARHRRLPVDLLRHRHAPV
jgi:hypothetical protein